MSFILPTRRLTPPRFNESSTLRSPRDYDASPRLWQKNATINQQTEGLAQAVIQMKAELNRIRRRHIAVPWVQFHPFKIYNWPNGADTWRSFAVRGGYVGLRRFHNTAYDPGELTAFTVPHGRNWEEVFYVNNGTDFVAPYLGEGDFEQGVVDAGYTKTTVTVTGSAAGTGVGQTIFVIDDNPANFSEDGTGALMAGFWIQVTNDATETKFEVKCRLFVFGSHSGGISPLPWPDNDPDIIPVGIVGTRSSVGSADFEVGRFTVNQYLFEHATGRYPFANGGIYRGDLDADPTLTGQIYYPGDTLTVASVPAWSTAGYTALIRYNDDTAPSVPVDYSDFTLIGKLKT